MLNLTDDQKRTFYTSGFSNNWILTFLDTGLVITNETIHSETPVIKESICDAEDFTLGGCIASSMEFEVSEILADEIAGLEFAAQIEVKNDDGEAVLLIPMGTYRVDNAALVDDKDYKKVTSYDRMYDISVDVVEWYNEYFANDVTHTVKETRESLLTYLGIPFVIQTLPNDDVDLEKTIDATSMSGTDVLRSLCVINGGFGRMNRRGEFEVICLTGLGLFPEDSQGEDENIYPSETLYPEDYFEYLGVSDGETVCPEYRSTTYEEYITMPITCLNIQSTTDDVGVLVGDDLTNPYVITANFLLYGKTAEELQEIGQNILGKIKGITYRPNNTTLDGLPYMEVGDVFALEKKNDSVESYIFSRTLSGIQALIDTYEAKGNYIRANEVSANDEIIQLKGRTLEIKKSVDELSIEMINLEEDTSTKFTQTAESIATEVRRASRAEEELASSLELTTGSIVLKVDGYGNIVEASLTADPKEGSSFKVTAQNIELTADEVLTLLSGGTINLSGKNINIESDNFSVDESGNVQANSIEITGGSINVETGLDSDDCIVFNYKEDTGNGFYNAVITSMTSDGIAYSKSIPTDNQQVISSVGFGSTGTGTSSVGITANSYEYSSELYIKPNSTGAYGWIHNGMQLDISVETNGEPGAKDAQGLSAGDLAVDTTTGKVYMLLGVIAYIWKDTDIVAQRTQLLDETCWYTDDSFMGTRFIGDLQGDVQGNLYGVATAAECDENGLNIADNYLLDKVAIESGDSTSKSVPSSLDVWNSVSSGVTLQEEGVYIVFGQVNFASNAGSGTRCCRIVFDGEEYSRSQVVTNYYCALQCTAVIEASNSGTVHMQAQQNCGSVIGCSGYINVIRIR